MVSSDESNLKLSTGENDVNRTSDDSEPMEVETNLNSDQVESSSSNIQTSSENIEKNNDPVNRVTNSTHSAIAVIDSNNSNASQNCQQSNNNLNFALNFQIHNQGLSTLTNMINVNSILQIEQNIASN